MNKSIFYGRIAKDIELRNINTANGGMNVTNFSIAVKRKFVGKDSVDVDFVNVMAFGKTAELISKYFAKGDRILVEAHFQTRNYKNKEGNMVYGYDFIIDSFDFVDNKKTFDTQQPMGQMQQPMNQMQQPMNQMQQPMDQMQQPMDQMQQPMSQMQQPMGQMQQPMGQTQQSMNQMQQPMCQTQQPMNQMQQPMSQMQQPMSQMQQPVEQFDMNAFANGMGDMVDISDEDLPF